MDALDGLLNFRVQAGAAMRQAVEYTASAVREAGLEAEALQRLESRCDTGGAWVRAALLEPGVTPEEADTLYARVVDPQGREIPDVLLRRARLMRQTGHDARAAALLRLALRMQPAFSFFVQAEALAKKLRATTAPRRKIKVALTGSSTNSLLRSVLEVLFFRDEIEAVFYESPFAAFRQEIYNSKSPLFEFAPDFIVLLLNWRDAGLPAYVENPAQAMERLAADIRELWDRMQTGHPCHIIQPSFDLSASDPYHALSGRMSGSRVRLLGDINRLLEVHAPHGVTLVNTQSMAFAHAGMWEDPVKWSSAKLHPSPEALPLLSEHIASIIRSVLGLSSKLLALDLDNTLWGGVIGEDGLGGIALGPPSPLGERYQELHHYVKSLTERGILLAAVSKNNARDAEEVFRRHDASVLRMEDFVSFEVNWNDKPSSLKRIARKLSIGLDSFVFLDDSPAERAAIRAALPEVIVPEISGEPSESIAALERGLYFQAIEFTQEDATRAASYTARARMQEARETGNPDFLVDLGMELEWGAVDSATATRAAQLINKTNQFNLNTRRYTQPEVESLMRCSEHWFRWFRLRDRYADHGLIAVLLAERAGRACWTVDLWLMSCRVIGRGVEQFMFNQLVMGAREERVASLKASYVPSAKNQLVSDLLPKLGFTQEPEEHHYSLAVSQARLLPCPGLNAISQNSCEATLITNFSKASA